MSGVGRGPPVQPQGQPDRHADRSARGAARHLPQLRARLSLQRRARRVRAAVGDAADARRGRGDRRARAPVRTLGPGGRRSGGSISPTRPSGSATRGRPRSATRPTARGSSSRPAIEITRWLAADLDVTFTRSRFAVGNANGGGLALAPRQTWAGGLSARHPLGPGVARGGLRFFGIGDRPASDDGVLVAQGFTEVDLAARLPAALVRPRPRHREPAQPAVPLGAVRDHQPAAQRAGGRRRRPRGVQLRPGAARARARRRPRERPLLRLRRRRLHPGVSLHRAPDGHPLPGLIMKTSFSFPLCLIGLVAGVVPLLGCNDAPATLVVVNGYPANRMQRSPPRSPSTRCGGPRRSSLTPCLPTARQPSRARSPAATTPTRCSRRAGCPSRVRRPPR